MPSTKPLLHIVVDPELLERIDDFRFARRFASRSAAIKWLVEDGLERAARDQQRPPHPR